MNRAGSRWQAEGGVAEDRVRGLGAFSKLIGGVFGNVVEGASRTVERGINRGVGAYDAARDWMSHGMEDVANAGSRAYDGAVERTSRAMEQGVGVYDDLRDRTSRGIEDSVNFLDQSDEGRFVLDSLRKADDLLYNTDEGRLIRDLGSNAKDLGLSFVKGAVDLAEVGVGVGDLLSNGGASRFLRNDGEAYGLRTPELRKMVESWQSQDYLDRTSGERPDRTWQDKLARWVDNGAQQAAKMTAVATATGGLGLAPMVLTSAGVEAAGAAGRQGQEGNTGRDLYDPARIAAFEGGLGAFLTRLIGGKGGGYTPRHAAGDVLVDGTVKNISEALDPEKRKELDLRRGAENYGEGIVHGMTGFPLQGRGRGQ